MELKPPPLRLIVNVSFFFMETLMSMLVNTRNEVKLFNFITASSLRSMVSIMPVLDFYNSITMLKQRVSLLIWRYCGQWVNWPRPVVMFDFTWYWTPALSWTYVTPFSSRPTSSSSSSSLPIPVICKTWSDYLASPIRGMFIFWFSNGKSEQQKRRIQTSLEITSWQVIGNICRSITDKRKELEGE